MLDWNYIAIALTVAVGLTVALRTLPFIAKRKLANSRLLEDLSRWVPLGAVSVLAVYCLSVIDFSAPDRGLGPTVGAVTTLAVHIWRRNAVLSIAVGTLICLLIVNLPLVS